MSPIGKIRRLGSTRYLVKRQMSQFIIGQAGSRRFKSVLDIGAGRAPYRKYIACDHYTAVDIEDRGSSGVADTFILADSNLPLPLESSSYDLVLTIETLEHIREPAMVLAEIHRLLAPLGRAILTVPFVWMEHEAPNDYWRFTRYGLKKMLEDAGFKKVSIVPSSNFGVTLCQMAVVKLKKPIFWPIVFAANVVGRIISGFGGEMDWPLTYFVVAEKE